MCGWEGCVRVGGVCVGGRGVCGRERYVRGGACLWRDCHAMLIEWSPSHLSPFFHTQLQSCMADEAINRAEYCLVVFGNVPMSRSKLLEWSPNKIFQHISLVDDIMCSHSVW